jgi:ribonucleoside-diphosphate reductase beta chain
MQKTYTLGSRTFVLDQAKAEAALAAKRVVGGRETMTFNLLPLRYGWAYELYRTMKANHWEPEDVQMAKDIEQWRSAGALSDIDRWIVRNYLRTLGASAIEKATVCSIEAMRNGEECEACQ